MIRIQEIAELDLRVKRSTFLFLYVLIKIPALSDLICRHFFYFMALLSFQEIGITFNNSQ